MEISIIITAFKEPKTIGRAIEAIESQDFGKHETIIVAPDDETLRVAYDLKGKYNPIRTIKDSGKGKPSALNLAVSKAKGEILILTDGDVYVDKNSIGKLIEKFSDKKIGAVCGRVISLNSKKNKMGFWAYVLTEIAHKRRGKAVEMKRRFFCTGYLFAIRKDLFPNLPEELLSEDGFISEEVYKKKFRIAYCPEARVYVKYPTNFKDWIKQKKRSAGGYNQIKLKTGKEIRSSKSESLGAFGVLRYASSLKEFFWILQLFMARIYLWFVIYRDINFKKKNHREIWERVESTK